MQQLFDEACQESFMTALDDCGRQRMLSLGLPGAAGWLTALPSPQLGLAVPGQSFQTALALRLGLPVGDDPDDPFGHNALSSKGRWCCGRHNDIRDAIWAACRTFDSRARIEQKSRGRKQQRPTG